MLRSKSNGVVANEVGSCPPKRTPLSLKEVSAVVPVC